MRYAHKYTVTDAQITQDVAPVAEPVTLAEMKTHCRVDHDDDDTILTAQIAAAREWVEKECNIALVQRTYTARFPCFAEMIELPRYPLASVTAIKYWSTDSPSVLTTLHDTSASPQVVSTRFRVNTDQGFIYRNYSETWPAVDVRHDAVQVTYVAGYAPDDASPTDHAANVPEAIKAALKLLVADMYEHREDHIHTGLQMHHLPTARALLNLYRRYW